MDAVQADMALSHPWTLRCNLYRSGSRLPPHWWERPEIEELLRNCKAHYRIRAWRIIYLYFPSKDLALLFKLSLPWRLTAI
jgi:hypothetical protein